MMLNLSNAPLKAICPNLPRFAFTYYVDNIAIPEAHLAHLHTGIVNVDDLHIVNVDKYWTLVGF